MKILLATFNEGKVREYRNLLWPLQLDVISLRDANIIKEVEETGANFTANALLKAKGYRNDAHMWVLADDSGLEVDALNGAPGVMSARYAGPKATDRENLCQMLKSLSEVEKVRRTARFRCVIALASPDGRAWTFDGQCPGLITYSPRGNYGFGYDPIFLLPKLGLTMAEIEPGLKDQISHRAEAARNLRAFFWYLVSDSVC